MTVSVQHSQHFPVVFRSESFPVPHGMFTRNNGVSPPPYSSFNLSLSVGDNRKNVLMNRQQLKKTLGIDTLVTSQQIHSDKVFCADAIIEDSEIQGYDALVTGRPGTGLLIQQADCQAILLYDSIKKIIGAIHCGWRGSVLNISRKTIEHMILNYGSDPASIHAVISPSLGPCCAEFINYKEELPESLHHYQVEAEHFDFWKISKDQLIAAGLQEKHIESTSICTSCSQDFFSYRRMKKKGGQTTGRHGSAICLKR